MTEHPALRSIEDGFHETDYASWKNSPKLMVKKLWL